MSSTVAVVQDWVLHGYFAFNDVLQSYSPLALIAATTLITFVIVRLHTIQQSDKGIGKRTRLALFNYLRKIPIVRRKVAEEIRKVNLELTHSMHMTDRTGTFLTSIPEKGMKSDALIQFAEVYNSMEGPRYLEGRVSGAVFNDESNMEEMHVYKEVFTKFAWSNPLWPKLFPGVRKMEAEVVRMCATLMNGDENTCGTMSTGGTISILLACLAHRNRALRKGIEFPEMVLPTSAHAAFTKAGELFRMKIVHIPVDKATYKVDLNIMRRSITSRTAMLVGSAPNFPFGTIDDIEAIAQMGLEHDIPVHVDGCLGGFLLPFLDDAPPFDFRVPGVCSISADTHKYGLAPKGSSVVLYRNKDYLHNQYFCDADWQGGIYASSTMEGSRSGLNIALCWSSLLFHGWQGYQAKSGDVVRTTRQIRDGIAGIPELRLQGDSNWCIVSFTSNVIDIHRFHDLMGRQDWQLSNLQFPSGVHLMVTLNHTAPGVADAFLEACRRCVKEIVQTPNEAPQGAAALYGMAQKIPDRSIVQEFAYAYLDACYSAPSH